MALVTLTFFNHVGHWLIHNTGAATFFVGNALVFVIFTPKEELWLKVLLATIMILVLAGHVLFGWYSLLVAESFSLVIAAHFLLEAMGLIK